MLSELISNDWVHVSSGLVLEDKRRIRYWVGSNVEKWGDHRIERRISL